jgi:hypothetical protein
LKKHGKINAVGEGTKPKAERERSARTQLQSPHDNFSLGLPYKLKDPTTWAVVGYQ